MSISQFLLVFLGGGLGAMARFGLVQLSLLWGQGTRIPWAIFVVNVLGSFVFGLLAALAERHFWLSRDVKLLLMTGVLGGFTTFSTFSWDTFYLWRGGFPALAVLNATASVTLGVSGVALGWRLGQP